MTPPASRGPLGLTSLTALVVANMVGAGVFTTSGFALADLGSPARVMAAWICGGIIALCGALSYGALARRFQLSGGEYLFLSRAVHPLAGFVAGWVSLLAGFTGAIAFAAITLESYVPAGLVDSFPRGSLAATVILVAALLHGARVRGGAFSQNAAVALKLGLVAVFVGLVLAKGRSPGFAEAPPLPPFSLAGFAASLVWISLSYSGFNAAIYVAGEADDARRNVPRALVLGTVLVTVIYLLLNAIFVFLPTYESVAGRPDVAAAAAEAIGGMTLANVVRAVIGVALITSVSSMIMAGPRVYARMADDGLFPALFRFRGTMPRMAIAMQASLAILVVLVAELKELLSYLGFTLSLSAAFAVSSLFLLRRREGAEAVPVLGYPFVPLVYVGATLILAGLAARRSPWELVAALLTIASGSVAYRLLRRSDKIPEEIR